MNQNLYRLFLITLGGTFLAFAVHAQSPKPIVIQAMTPVPAPATQVAKSSAPAQDAASLNSVLKALEQVKAANEETLKRQQALLEQLDALEKSADQMRIFTKRG